MKKYVIKIVCLFIAVLLLSAPIQVLACACPESNLGGMQYYSSCSNGCWYRVCTVHGTEATGNHNSVGVSAHGRCVLHTCSYCSVCGVNECTTAHNPCGHGTCSHSCKTHHANHCLVCHQEPCACYPAASNISIPTGWKKQLSVSISNAGATGHKIYDSSYNLVSDKSGSSCIFDVSANGKWYVRPYNTRGENPAFQEITINNIDNSSPNIINVLGNPTQWQTNDVTISVVATDIVSGLHAQAFSFDGGLTWQASNSFVYQSNGLINNICVRDAAENITNVLPFEISKIDKTAPEVVIEGNPEQWQTENVTINIIAKDLQSGLPAEPYSFDGGLTWGVANNRVFTNNQIVGNIQVSDVMGNIFVVAPFEITKIDRAAPVVSVSGNPEQWQNEDVTIVVTANDDKSGLHSEAYSFDGGLTWQASNTYTYQKNCVVNNIKVRDALKNIADVQSFEITKIDKSTPVIDTTSIPSGTTPTGDSLISYLIEDIDSGLTNDFELTTWAVHDKASTIHTVTIPYTTSVKARAAIETKKQAVFELGVKNNPNIKLGDIICGEIVVTDLANNKTIYTISEMMLDNFAPLINKVDISRTWSSYANLVEISAIDNETSVTEWGFSNSEEKTTIKWLATNKFDITENGVYFAFAKDLKGNISAPLQFTVRNVDRSTPTITSVTHNQAFTSTEYVFTVTAADIGSGVTAYGVSSTATIPTQWQADNKFVVKNNGEYYFYVIDAAGNVSAPYPLALRLIDRAAPTLDYSLSTTWTSTNLQVAFTATDDSSGIKNITLPNGASITDNAFSYEFKENGVYNFSVADNAGNVSNYAVSINVIDKLKPKITYEIIENETDKTALIVITASDALSGVQKIYLPNNTVIKGAKATFEIIENGSYTFKVLDNAGNKTEQTIIADLMLLKKSPEKTAQNINFGLIGLSIAGVVGVAGASTTVLTSAAINNALGSGSGGVLISYLFAGADAIVVDHKRSKRRRIKICDGIIDLTLAAEQAQTTHFTILLSKKYVRKNIGKVVKIVIENNLISSTILKADTLKIVI